MEPLKRTVPQISLDSQALYDRLKKAAIGEFIPYAALSGLIDRDVTGKARGCLTTAMRAVLSRDRMVFSCIRSEGVKRLADAEIVGIGPVVVKKLRKAAKRGIRKLSCVQNFDSLTPEQKTKHNSHVSVLGALHQACQETSIKKVEQKVEQSQQKLSLAGTLDAFKKK